MVQRGPMHMSQVAHFHPPLSNIFRNFFGEDFFRVAQLGEWSLLHLGYLGNEIIPSLRARTTAWVRSETLRLSIMCSTWFLTVPTLTTKSSAIWRLVFPWAN